MYDVSEYASPVSRPTPIGSSLIKVRLLPTGATRLQAGGVDHLEVNNQLATTVIDD